MTTPQALKSIGDRLAAVPNETDVALIIRHAEREDIPPGTFGVDVSLTTHGVASAERFGATLTSLRPGFEVTTSPVPRCVHTAEAILRGGGFDREAALDWRLGDPGPFVVDTETSGALFLETGILEITRRQISDVEPPPGMRETSEGVGLLLDLTAKELGNSGRLNVYVTHDSILAVLVAYLYKLSVDDISWPGYLDGMIMWRSSEQLHFAWRGLQQASYPLSR